MKPSRHAPRDSRLHVAVAAGLLDDLDCRVVDPGVVATVAQVHATLALVEALRELARVLPDPVERVR